MPKSSASGPSVTFWRDASLPFVEGRRASNSRAAYRPHTHPTFSIGIVDEGRSRVSFAGDKLTLGAGDVVLIAPGVVHACNPSPNRPWAYRMFHFDPAWIERVRTGVGVGDGAAFAWKVLRSGVATGVVDRLTETLVQTAPPSEKDSRLRAAVSELFRCAARPGRADRAGASGQDRRLAWVRDYLVEQCCGKVSLQAVARRAGLSYFEFLRRFQREFGLTPHAFLLDQRINTTRRLLRSDRALAEIAYETGFADQSHFQRTFKARVAATPAQYRAPGGPAVSM